MSDVPQVALQITGLISSQHSCTGLRPCLMLQMAALNCWWHCFIKLRVFSLAEGDVSLGVILEISKASPHQQFTLSFVMAVQDVNNSCFSTRHFLPGFPLMVEVDFIPLERDTQKNPSFYKLPWSRCFITTVEN